jgi:hypothetical protein
MSADERTLGERVAYWIDLNERVGAGNTRAVDLLREQQAEIERLTGHNRELDLALISVKTEHNAVMDERNQLRRDLEAARVDVERLAQRLLNGDRPATYELRDMLDASRARGEG